jgi:hypothetical protein
MMICNGAIFLAKEMSGGMIKKTQAGDPQVALVTVRTFTNEADAELAKTQLKSAGIRCFLSGDDCGGLRPALTMTRGIKVVVRADDGARAAEILGEENLNSRCHDKSPAEAELFHWRTGRVLEPTRILVRGYFEHVDLCSDSVVIVRSGLDEKLDPTKNLAGWRNGRRFF